MKAGKIRPLAVCVFYHAGKILVQEGYDRVDQQLFYRPLGGRIEFGELGAQTVVRELREEIDAEACNIRYLGTLENIFTYNGEKGHEIVLVYDGSFRNPAIYQKHELVGSQQDENGFFVRALWKPLSEMRDENDPDPEQHLSPVYPTGLLELLRKTL